MNDQTEKPTLLDFQKQPRLDLTDAVASGKNPLLLGVGGSGKSFVGSEFLENWLLKNPEKDFKFFRVLILCPKSAKIHWQRMLKRYGIIDALVWNSDKLRSKEAEEKGFVRWESRTMSNGEIDLVPHWNKENAPDLIMVDECHWFKNIDAQRTKVLQAYIDELVAPLNSTNKIIFISATPFYRLIETKPIVTANRFCQSRNFESWIKSFAGYHIDVTKASPAGNERMRELLQQEKAMVEITGVKFLHKTFTRQVVTDFLCAEDRRRYNNSWLDHCSRMRKLGKNPPMMAWLASMNKHREVAAAIRAPLLARDAFQKQTTKNKAIIIATDFVEPLRIAWRELVVKYKVPKELIGYIYGSQTETERQEQIDNFQSGKTLYMLMTQKTGKESISLDQFDKNLLPREVLLDAVWSPIQLAQVLWRAHRCLTQSTTYQYCYWYKDTIEERVAEVADVGMRSLGALLNKKTTWISLFAEEFNKDAQMIEDEAIANEAIDKEEDENILFDASLYENSPAEAKETTLVRL